MREFQEKKRFRKILYSKGTVLGLCILILFFGHATWNVYKKQAESAANALQAQNALQKLEERQKVLDAELKKLNSEEGIEEEIRSKFGVSKPGEQILIIIEDKKATTSAEEMQQTWWEKVKELFN
jgi:cell division protein FtsB